jgi:adenine-specific DNA methylase
MKHAIVAHRHSSEYLIHKCWARKPANVIREFITAYTQEGQIVLDPFCGSGVSVIEALRLGREALGIDVNPIAYTLTSVSTRPLNHARLRALWEAVLADWTELCATIVNALPTWIGLDQHEITSVMRRAAFVTPETYGHQSIPG